MNNQLEFDFDKRTEKLSNLMRYEYFLYMQSKESLISLIFAQKNEIESLKIMVNQQQATYEALQSLFSDSLCHCNE